MKCLIMLLGVQLKPNRSELFFIFSEPSTGAEWKCRPQME
jgi:hypothetical protein